MQKNILIIFLILFIAGCSTVTTLSNSNTTVKPIDIHSTEFWQGSTKTVWTRLQSIPPSQLQTLNFNNPEQDGWVKLALISKRDSIQDQVLVTDLTTWRTQYPNHVANSLIPNNLQSIANTNKPQHIALLVPLTGPFAKQGQAVRDGFLQAYYKYSSKNHIQQKLSFYDTASTNNIASIYQKAVNEGADFVAGPLLKEDVQHLKNNATFTVPTLALNYTDSWFGGLPANFYEFGLSPFDEATQVSDKAREAGHTRAILIAPQTDWGHKMAASITSRWHASGGRIVDTYYFTPQSDLPVDIANLLHVSPERATAIAREEHNATILDKQRRQDFDVIFLLAETNSAKQIVPLLRYYFAENIPIYSTSVIKGNTKNLAEDTDLAGIIHSDIPWALKGNASANRLNAVGYDSYLLSMELQRLNILPDFPLYGATGALTLTSSRKIYRRVPWVTM